MQTKSQIYKDHISFSVVCSWLHRLGIELYRDVYLSMNSRLSLTRLSFSSCSSVHSVLDRAIR